MRLSQAKPASCVSTSAQVKPFAGKVFYLDLPSNRKTETLESDIKDLGGVRLKHIWLLLTKKIKVCILSCVIS